MTVDRPLAKQAARNCMRTARVSPYQISLLLVVITIAMSAFEQFMLNLFGVPYYVEYGGYDGYDDSYDQYGHGNYENWRSFLFVMIWKRDSTVDFNQKQRM